MGSTYGQPCHEGLVGCPGNLGALLKAKGLRLWRGAPSPAELDAFLEAANQGEAQLVQEGLQRGIHVDARDKLGKTALHRAATEGRAVVVKELLVAGATVNAADGSGCTPLHEAASLGHKDVVETLLAAGANVNAAGKSFGDTPLHFAAFTWNTEIVPLLLRARADPGLCDSKGDTPLHLAARMGRTENVKRLLEAGADFGDRLVEQARTWGHEEISRLLQGWDKAAHQAKRDAEEARQRQEEEEKWLQARQLCCLPPIGKAAPPPAPATLPAAPPAALPEVKSAPAELMSLQQFLGDENPSGFGQRQWQRLRGGFQSLATKLPCSPAISSSFQRCSGALRKAGETLGSSCAAVPRPSCSCCIRTQVKEKVEENEVGKTPRSGSASPSRHLQKWASRLPSLWPSDPALMARPSYWSKEEVELPWNPVCVSTWELEFLKKVMTATGSFGGRDLKCEEPKGFTGIRLVEAWRVQNPLLWTQYAAKRRFLQQSVKAVVAKGGEAPKLKTKLTDKIPAVYGLDEQVNETFLIHGMDGQVIRKLCWSGFNQQLARLEGAFGAGVYLAEDPEKSDQYTTPGLVREAMPESAPAAEKATEEKVHFFLLCRVVFGHFLRTKPVQKNQTTCVDGKDLFVDVHKRELRQIEGSHDFHHGLLVELGPLIKRYREFVVYHGEQVYPEYLIAYQRTLPLPPNAKASPSGKASST